MKIEVFVSTDSEGRQQHRMNIDGKHRLSVASLCECPEDAIIGRDLVSCLDVVKYISEAHEAGKLGEELAVTISEVAEED